MIDKISKIEYDVFFNGDDEKSIIDDETTLNEYCEKTFFPYVMEVMKQLDIGDVKNITIEERMFDDLTKWVLIVTLKLNFEKFLKKVKNDPIFNEAYDNLLLYDEILKESENMWDELTTTK